MSVDEAVRLAHAVIADDSFLRIATQGIRADETHYLIPVLNTRPMSDGGQIGAHAQSRLLLIDRQSSRVERVSVPDALARAKTMRAVVLT